MCAVVFRVAEAATTVEWNHGGHQNVCGAFREQLNFLNQLHHDGQISDQYWAEGEAAVMDTCQVPYPVPQMYGPPVMPPPTDPAYLDEWNLRAPNISGGQMQESAQIVRAQQMANARIIERSLEERIASAEPSLSAAAEHHSHAPGSGEFSHDLGLRQLFTSAACKAKYEPLFGGPTPLLHSMCSWQAQHRSREYGQHIKVSGVADPPRTCAHCIAPALIALLLAAAMQKPYLPAELIRSVLCQQIARESQCPPNRFGEPSLLRAMSCTAATDIICNGSE